MSTEEIIDSFLAEDCLINLGSASSAETYHRCVILYNPEAWAELQTREDAASALPDKLLERNDTKSSAGENIWHQARIDVIEHLLTLDIFCKN